jgi:hypothetical protein
VPEGFRTIKRIKGLLVEAAKPIQSEAALQFTLRKTLRKTVTSGKFSATAADPMQGAV